MTREEYKNKLIEFNSTAKYRSEIDLLLKFLNPIKNEKILDIGCGIGEFVWKLRRKYFVQGFGYDVNNYRLIDDEHIFRNEFHFQFNKICFIHSFAHIPDVEYFIVNTIDKLLTSMGKIYILTPNKDWLDLNVNPEYISDPTIFNHYNQDDLIELFTRIGFKVELKMQFGDLSVGCNERILMIISR